MSRWFYVGLGMSIPLVFMLINQQTENKAGGYVNAPLETIKAEE